MTETDSTAEEGTGRCDPILLPYLHATDGMEADRALYDLLTNEAAPVIERLLRQKNNQPAQANPARSHSDDIASAARELLIRRLMALRNGERETPIEDFRAYTASVAFSAWAQQLRAENPQRSMLLNRVRYLLENRTRRSGFALWETASGRRWCGFSDWTSRSDPTPTPKLERLLTDPTACARDAFGDRSCQRDDLGALITDLFRWVECPIELRDLVMVLAQLLELSDRTDSLDVADDDATIEVSGSHQRPPDEEVAWKEYLAWLWREIGQLSTSQCAAFLLHSDVLREFELSGVASIRSVAPRVGLQPESVAEFWQQLPLDDLTIAAALNCTRQQVINLRRVARDNLGRAWSKWNANLGFAGNKPSVFTSSST